MIKKKLEALGLTQADLARLIKLLGGHCSRVTVYRWVSGHAKPSSAVLAFLAALEYVDRSIIDMWLDAAPRLEE